MKKTKIIWVAFIIIIVLSNVSPLFHPMQWYHFRTRDGKFEFDMIEEKGRGFNMMDRQWQEYKKNNQPTDTVIYRTFVKNPLKFWEWKEYFFSKKYQYPYLSDN